MESNTCFILIKRPQIGDFVEGQHGIRSPAWSGKTTDGLLASPLDCHKTAKMMPCEDASLAPHTSGPRDVPRCGALSLLQKDAALQGGIQQKPL